MDASPKPTTAGERRLAAVMFTDVANFSALTEANEEQALRAVQRDLQLMFDLLARHQGKLLKTLGDGLLAHFQSAVNAVNCAQDIQNRLADSRFPEGALILKHRIGIHVGDVFVTETDVLGNGVNIAARLQAKAAPGGICISQTVFDAVKHQIGLRVNYLGPQELKNIRDSVPAYQLLPEDKTLATPAPQPRQPSSQPMAASPGVRFEIAQAPASSARHPGQAADILLLGDFSGRSSRGIVESFGGRAPMLLDYDTFPSVFARLDVRLSLPVCEGQGQTLELRLAQLEDLHPDSLLYHAPQLARIFRLRSGLGKVSDRLPAAAPQKPAFTQDNVDAELTVQLRALLHHPDFQGLEAAWLGAALLVRDFGTKTSLRFHLLDLSRQELAAELAGVRAVSESGLARLLAAFPFTMVLANYYFGTDLADIHLLARIAQLAAIANVPVLTAGQPELVGCESFGRQPDPAEWRLAFPQGSREAWNQLRRSPAAAHLGVALPRFLLRQPYGAGSAPIESFPFEELPPCLPHESYLWSNPVFACGHAVARSLLQSNRPVNPSGGQITGLPIHRFKEDGETAVKPAAEAWLTDRAATAIERCGLIPLRSVKGADAVLVPHFQSLAEPSRPLAWRRLGS